MKETCLTHFHTLGLAADIALFKNGEYLTDTEDYRKVGNVWEKLGTKVGNVTYWGGRFGDGGHFSIPHNGVK